jgi:hypothetical protein
MGYAAVAPHESLAVRKASRDVAARNGRIQIIEGIDGFRGSGWACPPERAPEQAAGVTGS